MTNAKISNTLGVYRLCLRAILCNVDHTELGNPTEFSAHVEVLQKLLYDMERMLK